MRKASDSTIEIKVLLIQIFLRKKPWRRSDGRSREMFLPCSHATVGQQDSACWLANRPVDYGASLSLSVYSCKRPGPSGNRLVSQQVGLLTR